MKIWLMTTEYPPFFGGGIATYCYHTAKMFAERGDSITVFVADPSIKDNLIEEESGNRRIIRFKPGMSGHYRFMGYSAALSYEFCDVVEKYILKEGRPDVIEVQDYAGIGYALLQKKKALYLRFKNIPVVVTIHTPKFLCNLYDQAPIYRLPDFWIGEMEKFVLKAADGVISPSKFMLKEVKKRSGIGDISFVVPNPFDFSEIKPVGNINKNEILFVGRVQYIKGILQLLSYLSRMWEDNLTIPLKIVGGDTFFHPKNQMMSDYLKSKFKKYIDKGLVVFEGKMPPEKLYRRMSESSFIVFPSIFENYPTVVVEAMALGMVVLASESGGQSEMIEDGVSGFLFSHKDANTFYERMNKVLRMSEEELLSIGRNARKRIEEISGYDMVYPKKMEALESIIEKSKGEKRYYPFVRGTAKSANKKFGFNVKQKGLLSVIIPYFNMGEYIEETVKSVVKSDYDPMEIIIVNDGSDEPLSVEMLYRLENRYPIKVLHKKNEGLARTRNFGAEAAKGEYITFLDADDLVSPDYYRKAIEILEYYENVSFVGCWSKYFGDCAEAIWPTWNPEPPFLLVHNMVNSSALVYRRADFLESGLNDPEMEYGMEDYESVVRMLKEGFRGIIIPEPMFKYRVRRNSMSRGFNRNNMLYLYNLIAEKNRQIYQEYAVEVIGLLNANGPGFLYDNPTVELPQVGFLKNSDISVEVSNIDLDNSLEIPYEIKQIFRKLWTHTAFRKSLGIALNMTTKVSRLFHKK